MNYEFVPDNVSEKDLREEVNHRTAKAGYTTGLGECPYRTKVMAAPPNKQYEENYERIDWSK
jgi:hypothetical protein